MDSVMVKKELTDVEERLEKLLRDLEELDDEEEDDVNLEARGKDIAVSSAGAF